MNSFLLWATLGLAPFVPAAGLDAGCPKCECCGCCETGSCQCSDCTCECCGDECPTAGLQAEREACCGSGCCTR